MSVDFLNKKSLIFDSLTSYKRTCFFLLLVDLIFFLVCTYILVYCYNYLLPVVCIARFNCIKIKYSLYYYYWKNFLQSDE